MAGIQETAQSLDAGEIVHLYSLDATALGAASVIYFTNSAYTSSKIVFNGITYDPLEFETDGWEWSGQGGLPTPTIKISNVTLLVSELLANYRDLVGAIVTRTRTFKEFLDGEPNADPNAIFPLDVYRVERKSSQNNIYVEFELSSFMDQEGRLLPGRQILRDTCTHRYRKYVTGTTFDYTNATCPYAGSNYFDAEGNALTADAAGAAADRCGRRVSDCSLRFPNSELPTRAFPGVGRTRVQ